LTIDRTVHRRELDGAAGEFGADRDLSRGGASADDEQKCLLGTTTSYSLA
jgi:hypothetical protein